MDHRDSLNHLKGKRSFGIKLARKPHKQWPEVLSTLRVRYSNVDINEVNLGSVNLYGNKKNPVRPQRKKLEPEQNPFDEKVEQLRRQIEKTELDDEDKIILESLRRGRIVCGPDTGNFDIDVLMPNLMSVTLTVNGAKKLEEIKPEALLQTKRYPDQEQLSENTRYVFWFYDRKGEKQEIYDETRTLGSLDLMVPILFLREPDGHKIETKINEQITSAVGLPLTTIETSLDDECSRFRSLLFDSIQEAEKKREYEGLDHYAFPEETVLKGFGLSMRPANSVEMFESDLDEMQYNENLEESEERAVERLKMKIEASAGVAQVWYRPNETDDYTFFAQIGRDVIERTPIEVIEMSLEYLKRREGVEIKEPPEAFVLQVAGKQSFITRHIPLKRYEYIRSCFENYKTPVLILRLKSAIFPNYVKPPPIFVPAFIQAERNIKSERSAIENEKQRNLAKVAENRTKKLQMKIGKKSNLMDELDEEVPKSEPINFWDLDDELKIRILSASHLIITGIEKLYVKVAVTVGTNVLAQRDSPIVSPNNPRWGNCLLDFGLYLKDIPKSAQLCLSLISEKTKKKGTEATALGFVNIRLFDWEDYLLQGKKTVFFWPFPKDLNGLLNPIGLTDSNHDHTVARLEIELTDFGNKVRYPPFESVLQFVKIMQQRKARSNTSESLPDIEDFDENSENIRRLTGLRNVMDPNTLSFEDQRFLWQSRKKISSNFPSMLPIIVDLPMVWKTRETFCELYGMLVDWPLLQVDAAMEILDGKYTDTWIRDAAVDRIDRALDNDQLQLYLLPLVQALRYEPFANSGLAKMLVKRGLLNYKIGHTFFWLLRAELNYFDLSPSVVTVPKFYARFSICLEMYLRGNTVHLPGIVKQVELVNILTSLSLQMKNVGAKESATKKLQQELMEKKETLQNMVSPLNQTDRLGELLIDKCSVLGSAKQPLKLTWKNSEPLARLTAETHQILFKNGDDLRQDMLTLQVMRIMDAKWKIHNLDFCLTLYEVLPMGRNIGMIHVVQNCQTLFQIQIGANQVGSALSMDNNLLNKYLYQCSNDSKQYIECVDRFTSSLAGYCIATYVLGIKDRHQDNIMLAKDGRIFHIDFGHFLGHTKKKLGINRERTEFILTEHFLNIVSKGKNNLKDTYEYKSFRDSCVRGFLVMYHNARFFIILFRMMLCMGLPENINGSTTIRPNHVVIDENHRHIDVDSSWLDKKGKNVQRVGLDASDKEKVVLDLLTEQKQLSASASGSIAAAETSEGHRAQVQKFGDKGGVAQAGGHKGQLRTKEDSEGHHAYLKADNKYTLDTLARGSLKNAEDTDFVATNERFDFKLNPSHHNNVTGDGTLSFDDKEKGKSGTYAYTIRQDGKRTEADLTADDVGKDEFAQSLFGRRSDKYHCTAETPGISQCYDAQGRSVGKVVADKNGNTVVYNDKDVPIGTGSVKKINDRSYEAVISKNLFIARLKNVRRGACCKQLTGKECTDPIKLSNPKFSSPSERDEEGKVHLTWPDCFDMSVDVTLPPGVHIDKLAMKLDVNIQPLGKLRCMDVATCGRECYYCDWCKNSRKLKLLENTDGNLCRSTAERTYRLTTKLCPPPEDPNFTLCSTFSKSVWQKDYWQKEGAVDVWMKFYQRGQNRAELEKEFFTQLDNPLLGKAFKLALIGDWLAANGLDKGSYTPTHSELMEYYVSKRDPDELLACEHAVIDYEIEGAKVKTNVLLEAATTANSLPNIFKDKKCAAFEQLQESRFQKEVQEFRSRGGSGGILGGLGNLFSGRRK